MREYTDLELEAAVDKAVLYHAVFKALGYLLDPTNKDKQKIIDLLITALDGSK